jgi:hypothetical protein
MKTSNMLMIWASLLGAPILTQAQSTLSGKITNHNQEGIPGARIHLLIPIRAQSQKQMELIAFLISERASTF